MKNRIDRQLTFSDLLDPPAQHPWLHATLTKAERKMKERIDRMPVPARHEPGSPTWCDFENDPAFQDEFSKPRP